MKTSLWIAAVVAGLAIVGTARYSAHQPDPGEVERILQSIRERGIPASIVRFPRTNSVLLQAGVRYSDQPDEWQRETLESLRAACGADYVWHTSVVPDWLPADRRLAAGAALAGSPLAGTLQRHQPQP